MQSDPTPVRLVDKYRPRKLSDVRGQPWVVEQLELWLKSPAPTAFIFAGGTGTGKTSTAQVLAAELGVLVDEMEIGGLYQIASGEQTGETVRNAMRSLACRPFMGSGWRVLIVNEADCMTANAAQVWLDALENIPPSSVVIFTTNSLNKIPRRFRDRCECLTFESGALLLRPHLEKFAADVWKAETGRNDCPALEEFGPIGDECGDASFRRLLQTIQPVVRQVKAGKQVRKRTEAAVAQQPRDLHAYGKRWMSGESIRKLAGELGMAWNALQAQLKAIGYKRIRSKVAYQANGGHDICAAQGPQIDVRRRR